MGRPVFCAVWRAWCRGPISYGRLWYSHPPAYQKPQSRISWCFPALVRRLLCFIRYVFKSWGIPLFVRITSPGTRVLPWAFKKHPDCASEQYWSRKLFGLSHGFKVCTGARCLGSSIGDNNYKREWLKYRTETWEQNICAISKTAGKYTQ